MSFLRFALLIGSLFFALTIDAQTKYDLHLNAARATGIIPIKNTAHVNRLVAKRN